MFCGDSANYATVDSSLPDAGDLKRRVHDLAQIVLQQLQQGIEQQHICEDERCIKLSRAIDELQFILSGQAESEVNGCQPGCLQTQLVSLCSDACAVRELVCVLSNVCAPYILLGYKTVADFEASSSWGSAASLKATGCNRDLQCGLCTFFANLLPQCSRAEKLKLIDAGVLGVLKLTEPTPCGSREVAISTLLRPWEQKMCEKAKEDRQNQQQQQSVPSTSAVIDLAMACRRAGDVAQELRLLSNALSNDRSNVELIRARSLCYRKLGKHRLAALDCLDQVAAQPLSCVAWSELGDCYRLAKCLRLAALCYEQVLALMPGYSDVTQRLREVQFMSQITGQTLWAVEDVPEPHLNDLAWWAWVGLERADFTSCNCGAESKGCPSCDPTALFLGCLNQRCLGHEEELEASTRVLPVMRLANATAVRSQLRPSYLRSSNVNIVQFRHWRLWYCPTPWKQSSTNLVRHLVTVRDEQSCELLSQHLVLGTPDGAGLLAAVWKGMFAPLNGLGPLIPTSVQVSYNCRGDYDILREALLPYGVVCVLETPEEAAAYPFSSQSEGVLLEDFDSQVNDLLSGKYALPSGKSAIMSSSTLPDDFVLDQSSDTVFEDLVNSGVILVRERSDDDAGAVGFEEIIVQCSDAVQWVDTDASPHAKVNSWLSWSCE